MINNLLSRHNFKNMSMKEKEVLEISKAYPKYSVLPLTSVGNEYPSKFSDFGRIAQLIVPEL